VITDDQVAQVRAAGRKRSEEELRRMNNQFGFVDEGPADDTDPDQKRGGTG
jgi:hypothetical protein